MDQNGSNMGRHRWVVGVHNPLKTSVMGPNLLGTWYLEKKFHKKKQGEHKCVATLVECEQIILEIQVDNKLRIKVLQYNNISINYYFNKPNAF